ncbi:MAG: hypothetical protein V1779_03545 [bacterium]
MRKQFKILLMIAVMIQFSNYIELKCQADEAKAYVPDRIIMWDKVGQREVLKKCEEHLIIYVGAESELTYMRYIESRIEDEYILELASHATQAKPKPIDVTQSIIIPADGSSPIALKRTSDKAAREIVFSKMGQKEQVLSGETVNIKYEGVNPDKVYIAYESFEDGYYLELSSLMEQKVVNFAKRCQSFIVASPATTTIRIDEAVRYEQIVWTPREDNSWEVRIGTVEQGCRSVALDAIKKLRTREYETSVPVEKKGTKGR